MSAQILKERCLAAVGEVLNENGRQMMNLRYRPAQKAMDGDATIGVMPPSTAEQLGLQAAELNAMRQGVMQVVEIIEAQYKALVAPEEQPDALVEGKTNGAARPEAIY